MRLAWLCTDPGIPYGGTKGASVHLAAITSAVAAQGAEVLLVVAATAGPLVSVPAGVTLEVWPGVAKHSSPIERLTASAASVDWLADRIHSWGAVALYERMALYSTTGQLTARRLGLQHVVEMNSPLPLEAATYRSLERPEAAVAAERAVLEGAALVHAVSRPLADYARSRGAARVSVLPNAVAIEDFPAVPRPADAPPVAAFLGTLRPWHGIGTIASAWQLMADAAPALLVVGDGPGRAVLESVGATVTGAVPHERVPFLLSGASIGLAPYAPDAPAYFSPLKVFEYLAAGLAVVAADIPGVTDVVSPAEAVLVPAGCAAGLAEAVTRLAQDRSAAVRMGARGRALVAAKHTWSDRARTVLADLSDLGAEVPT